MALLHDSTFRDSVRQRISSLSAISERRWGRMSVDQMLHHVNIALESALGRVKVRALKVPLPGSLLKFFVLNLPWPRSAPTAPEFVSGDRYDFEAERARCLVLIEELSGRPLNGDWPAHQSFGTVTGSDYSRLHAKHLDHHLRQFGA